MPTAIIVMNNALRLDDHPALVAACDAGAPIVPVFIHDGAAPWAPGGARRWWLMKSLEALDASFRARGSRLILRRGNIADEVLNLASDVGADTVYLTRDYGPQEVAFERHLHDELAKHGGMVRRFAGNLLLEPEEIRTGAGGPYSVFTPFWRRACELIADSEPLAAPTEMPVPTTWPHSLPLEAMGLAPRPAFWADPIAAAWEPGEDAARRRLACFLEDAVAGYASSRDIPGTDGTSRLSPYLAGGELSPRRIWREAMLAIAANPFAESGIRSFLREVGWREFCRHLLFHFPHMPDRPLKDQFQAFPWQAGEGELLHAWQKGLTGFPIIDAGMRQLWQTGWMHNRVRMIVASFLVKDMLWHWRAGEDWFWDTLVDADLANNAAGWQWVAGCGADAAPYFRIFNPVTQGEKFDPGGRYVREFLPELAGLPDAYIHKPFEAPKGVLEMAGVTLGESYPLPVLDRKRARDRALAALQRTKVSA